jgi:hypothetical protein
MLNATVSAKAYLGIWQLAQLTEESFERIFSENSLRPSAAFVLIPACWISKKELMPMMTAMPARKRMILYFITTNLGAAC